LRPPWKTIKTDVNKNPNGSEEDWKLSKFSCHSRIGQPNGARGIATYIRAGPLFSRKAVCMLNEVFCGWLQLSCLSTCSLPPPFKLFRFPAWAVLLSFPLACARSNIRWRVLVDTCANWCVDSTYMLYATFAYCPAEVELVCRWKCVGLTSFDPSTAVAGLSYTMGISPTLLKYYYTHTRCLAELFVKIWTDSRGWASKRSGWKWRFRERSGWFYSSKVRLTISVHPKRGGVKQERTTIIIGN
jgi:hypothetical protein